MGSSLDSSARLACFELWGGNSAETRPVELPGLQGWVSCTPFGRARSGGDVHYMSVCSKGQVSRVALADVSGHGDYASAMAVKLRRIFQQHTDNWDQSSLMRELNEAFSQDVEGGQFATAVVLGFYIGTGELVFSNAGHLPLLWHHAATGRWDWLEDTTPFAREVADLPLGLIRGTGYAQTAVELQRGDTLLLYTDGITECLNERGEELGPEGLIAIVNSLSTALSDGPVAFGNAMLSALTAFRGSSIPHDDETIVLLQRELEPEVQLADRA